MITANGRTVTTFNNASIAFSVGGMGTDGIVSLGFSFTVPVNVYPNYSDIFEGGAQVSVRGYNMLGEQSFQSETFYVSSKSTDGDTVNVKCYDRMTCAEADFPCTEEEFYDTDGNEIEMPANTVINRIGTEMSLAPQLNDDDLSALVTELTLPKSLLLGKTCRDALNTLAAAFCGVWCCRSGRLVFVPFGADISEIAEIHASAEKHEKLRMTSRLAVSGLYMTDNKNEFGTKPENSGTISINTPLARSELYSALQFRIRTLYQGYSCGNAYIDSLPVFPMVCTFAEDSSERAVNYCTVKLTAKGALATLGMNRIDEGEWVYKNRTRRELDSRYKDGDLWGNTEITKKGGIKHVYVNENGDKDRHGYEALDGGVTVYEGDMIDKFPAENITPEYDGDGKVKKITYFAGCVKTVLEIVWDGDNVLSYTRKKYKVDSCSTVASEMLLLNTGEETLIFGDENENSD